MTLLATTSSSTEEEISNQGFRMFQEFVGYLLLPTNKAQRMMIIKGNGGEGKSALC